MSKDQQENGKTFTGKHEAGTSLPLEEGETNVANTHSRGGQLH